MAVKLRLTRKGRKQAPFYHIIVADSRSSRDGKFIEKIGTYNPMTKPATIQLDRDAAYDWLTKGAQPTDTVRAILRFKGVYYKKHLMRGVQKGAMSMEQADALLAKWIDTKESRIEARKQQTLNELEAFRKMVSGVAKAKVVVADEATKEAGAAFMETADSVEEMVVTPVSAEVEATPEPVVEVVETPSEAAPEVASTEEAPAENSDEEAPADESTENNEA